MTNVWTDEFDTLLGRVFAAVDDRGAVAHLCFIDAKTPARSRKRATDSLERAGWTPVARPGACAEVETQVVEYLDGRRRSFDLRVTTHGTPFQEEVWSALQRVPYGTTASYRDVAERVDRPTAWRAVARANATNPVSLIVPCHRIIGSDGTLTGYGGGLPRKRALLELEVRGQISPSSGRSEQQLDFWVDDQ